MGYYLYRSKDFHTLTDVLLDMITTCLTVLKIVVYIRRKTDYKQLYSTIEATANESTLLSNYTREKNV